MVLTLFAWLALAPSNTACASCHPKQVKTHSTTSMAHALESGADCQILKANPLLAFRDGPYSYSIKRAGDHSIYTVTNGAETVSIPIKWAFGFGVAGQTYVFERDGVHYESRVSYYKSIKGLDLTFGNIARPKNILEAAGREMSAKENTACIACHSSGSIPQVIPQITPGVQCENCHQGSDRHAAAVRKGEANVASMPKLGKLNAEDMSELCGQCHRTWSDIAANGPLGIRNIRFPAYRLTNSKCYDSADARIACTACHDPHLQLNTRAETYDVRCMACHSKKLANTANAKPARICHTGKSGCVTCHMPKYEIPGSHYQFSDHQIRIVRAQEPYPN